MQRAHPLLERLRFLSISASNLDEFFMVRVAGLKAHQALGVEERSADGLTPAQQLAAIDRRGRPAGRQPARSLARASRRARGRRRRRGRRRGRSTEGGEAWLDQHFREQIFPVLTPQAIDPAHPFPFIPNRGFSLIFELRKGRRPSRSASC